MNKTVKSFLLVLVLFFSFTLKVYANKLVYCTSSYNNADVYYKCSWKDMRLYNQRVVSDMHCIPTAAAMGLSELTYAGVSYYTSSWTAKSFVYHTMKERIENFGDIMNTSSTGGTGWASGKTGYKNRKNDLPSATSDDVSASNTTIDNSFIRGRMLDRKVDLLDYGHYSENCSNILGVRYCNWDRNGGHGVTVNGYTLNGGNYGVQIYNPWNGVIQNYVISSVPNNSGKLFGIQLDGRPYGSKSRRLYDGKIIDWLAGLKSN